MILPDDSAASYPLGVYEYQMFDFPCQKLVDQKKAQLIFRERSIEAHVIFDSELGMDEDCNVFKPIRRNTRMRYRRDQVVAVHMYLSVMTDRDGFTYWTVEGEVLGAADPIKVHFMAGKEGGVQAKALYDRLCEYANM